MNSVTSFVTNIDRVVGEKCRRLNSAMILLCILPLLAACERRDITYSVNAEFAVRADWSFADQEEEKDYGATIIFYPHDGTAPHTVLMGDRTQTTVSLPTGHYSVLLFNRSFNDFSGIAFRGMESYHTLEAYAKKEEARSSSRVIVECPEKLATAQVEDFEVTAGMVNNARSTPSADMPALHLTPRPMTRQIEVQIYAEGLNNIKEARCTLSGIPVSIVLFSGELSQETATHEFELGNPVYLPGSTTDGTLSGTLNVFGFNPELPHEMQITALLKDNETIISQMLGKVQVSEDADDKGVIKLRIDAAVPEPIPDVKVGGSGLDVEVGDWGNEENSDIEL